MFGCECLSWNRLDDLPPEVPRPFSLPAPIPQWPPGQGFGAGSINLGDLEVTMITRFEFIWLCSLTKDKKNGVSFYKPVGLRDGFCCLGYYCQSNSWPLRGYVLAARDTVSSEQSDGYVNATFGAPALTEPLDYTLIWKPDDESDEIYDSSGYIWLPRPREGYKAVGYVVTNNQKKPDLEEMRCVRADLTDRCETFKQLFSTTSKFPKFPFRIWSTRPCHRGLHGVGVATGSFFCSGYWSHGEELDIACLKNLNSALHGMPNIDQIHALISHYGPTLYFHPDEVYFPSSVPWFFRNGAMLFEQGESYGEPVDPAGSNLPGGGSNDGKYWIDLPRDDVNNKIKHGNLESAVLYVHVKPALGGTFTDIVMWVFCPFNGPATLKIGVLNIGLSKIGQHVGDWEHFTLRISNFNGELWNIYFSQHSGGEWVEAYKLEFNEGNKAIVYSTKHGHASFPHPGTYIQGSSALGVGIRNDAAASELFIDSSKQYEVIAAEYLGNRIVAEPCWLQYMREWGPTIVYGSKTELDKIFNMLPVRMRYSVESVFNKLPLELYGEEGPTGPKEKNNWFGDERA
ncbi:unnamed protein product [Rhodiola kirilowii]